MRRDLTWMGMLILLTTAAAMGRSNGPAFRAAGAPGDNPLACTQCHNSFSLNSGKGSVRVVFPGGTAYKAGATYRMKVEVRDPDQVRWGFQLTARLASNAAVAQAGDFSPVSDFTRVVCQDGAAKPCADANQIQLIMHTAAGTRNGTPAGADFELDWTAPSAGAGQVIFYVAGNAANGNGNNKGDSIYTSSLAVDEDTSPAITVPETAYDVRHFVSDLPGYADRIDPNLRNPWGISMGPATPFWVSNGGTGTSTLYNTNGELFPVANPLVVRIPNGAGRGGPPKVNGQVWNGTPGFQLAPGRPAAFLFAAESGVIAAWNSAVDRNNAIVVADNPSAVYKGLALGVTPAGPMLYAANFRGGVIETFDYLFQPIATAGGFIDPNLPAGFAPFNIQRFGVSLYVAYARQDDSKVEDLPGEGNGIINVFDLNGNLRRRLVTGGPLNSPWGMAIAPAFFGDFSNTLLVGNWGDGRINAFDLTSGQHAGVLKYKNGEPVALEGLWGLVFGNNKAGGEANTLYFTAAVSGGGSKGDHGVFGAINVVP